jgi:hypothetical protein
MKKVVAYRGEDDVCSVAFMILEIAAAKVSDALQVSDDGFDG